MRGDKRWITPDLYAAIMLNSYLRRLTRPSGRNIPQLAEQLDEGQRRILILLAAGEASASELEGSGQEPSKNLCLALAHLAELGLVLVYPGESCWRLSHDGREASGWLPERASCYPWSGDGFGEQTRR